MDSFCSLFDPSDGTQNKASHKKKTPEDDNVKKKDGSKGRRRGRKSSNKHSYLPEESSFLCAPELSTEVLMRDAGYVDTYINKDAPTEPDKRPKRRNSSRKVRHKSNKVCPVDASTSEAWKDGSEDMNKWNNKSSYLRLASDHVGKFVNDLSDRSTNSTTTFKDLDKNLDKVTLDERSILNEEYDEAELEGYPTDSSDCDDSDNSSDGAPLISGRLPPEPRFGNVEYKLQLVSPGTKRLQHLVTQLKWRLSSGGGTAIYVLGVNDDGSLRGLRPSALRASLHTLRQMCRVLNASPVHACTRAVARNRAMVEVYIRRLADTQKNVELRVAVMGANEAGKSTLIGVLTQGELDNGRGSARLNMFRHVHEVKSGHTSSLSHEILGFDARGNVVNYGCSELMTAERIGERSAKLVSFLDLAGHSKYQRTTLHGISGYCPHVAMLLISACSGVTRITEEHISLLLALKLPFFLVLSKCELAPSAVNTGVQRAYEILQPHNKKPVLISDEESLTRFCLAPQKLILDALDNDEQTIPNEEASQSELIPVFPVSCVKGFGLSALHAYLLALQPPAVPTQYTDEDTCEFQIDEVFHVEESAGAVVGGFLARGSISEGDELLFGPLSSGSFEPTTVLSIHRHHARVSRVACGACVSLALSRVTRARVGHVLLKVKPPVDLNKNQDETPENRKKTRRKDDNLFVDLKTFENILTKDHFDETNLYKPDENVDKSDKVLKSDLKNNNEMLFKSNKKNDCNLFNNNQNIAKDVLIKNNNNDSVVKSGSSAISDSKVMGAVNKEVEVSQKSDSEIDSDDIVSEDPSNPRGCMFFQATVEILRHASAISPGFQCTVHVGNVRQTAIIEGIMSYNSSLRAGEKASCLFRFSRYPEYLVRGRRLLFTQGQGTRAIGRVTQVFPFVP